MSHATTTRVQELAGDPVWNARMFIRGLDRLPIACTIAPPATR